MVFVVEPKAESECCTACGSSDVWGHGEVVRRFRTVPLGSKRLYLEVTCPRFLYQGL